MHSMGRLFIIIYLWHHQTNNSRKHGRTSGCGMKHLRDELALAPIPSLHLGDVAIVCVTRAFDNRPRRELSGSRIANKDSRGDFQHVVRQAHPVIGKHMSVAEVAPGVAPKVSPRNPQGPAGSVSNFPARPAPADHTIKSSIPRLQSRLHRPRRQI